MINGESRSRLSGAVSRREVALKHVPLEHGLENLVKELKRCDESESSREKLCGDLLSKSLSMDFKYCKIPGTGTWSFTSHVVWK